MPIYPYKCPECGHTEDTMLSMSERNAAPFCFHCGTLMRRAMELQNITIRPDIEPGYDQSLGVNVGSRKDLRKALAYANAYCPDLMFGSEPSAGRLTKEERAIEEGRTVSPNKTIFERRKESGWGENPSPGEILRGDDPVIESDGQADYAEIVDYIKERSANG